MSLDLSNDASFYNFTDEVVLGCQTPEQVEDNCRIIDNVKKLNSTQMDKIHDAFADIDPRVINPRLWFNHF